jgi:hypothetical protein
VVYIFSNEYLRSPTNHNIARLLASGWPKSWFSRHVGFSKEMKVERYVFWSYLQTNYYFGSNSIVWSLDMEHILELPESHNDINVIEKLIFYIYWASSGVLIGPINYSINGNDYITGYYIADYIYLQRSTFVKKNSSPQGAKSKHFATVLESTRNDVEHTFRLLQAQFAIVRRPAWIFKIDELKNIMKACIIPYNMIVEDEWDEQNTKGFDYIWINWLKSFYTRQQKKHHNVDITT